MNKLLKELYLGQSELFLEIGANWMHADEYEYTTDLILIYKLIGYLSPYIFYVYVNDNNNVYIKKMLGEHIEYVDRISLHK